MNKLPIILGLATVAMTLGGRAAGFSEDFESYAAGSNVHGQGGWKGWDNNPAAGATISTAQALSGTRSVSVSGASDLVHEFGYSGGQWSFSFDQYIPTTASGTTYLILMNKYKDNGAQADYNWSVQIPINLATGAATDDMVSGGPGLTVTKGQWANWSFMIDLDANTVGTYYNNTLWNQHAWQSGGAPVLAAIDLYANNASAVYYDNVNVQQVPEPTTWAMLALGGLVLGWRRLVR